MIFFSLWFYNSSNKNISPTDNSNKFMKSANIFVKNCYNFNILIFVFLLNVPEKTIVSVVSFAIFFFLLMERSSNSMNRGSVLVNRYCVFVDICCLYLVIIHNSLFSVLNVFIWFWSFVYGN